MIYKLTNRYCLIALLILFGMTSCEQDNPIEKEQYKKEISIVGSQHSNDGYIIFDLACNDNGYSQAYVSVAVSGSLNSNKDIKVKLSDNVPNAIDEYNRVFVASSDIRNKELPKTAYQISDYTAVIKAGNSYGRLPIDIDTKSLEPDSLYALPFKIVEASDYDFRREDTVLIMAINLKNEYSGSYRQETYRSTVQADELLTDSVPMSNLRTLKAISEKVVRFWGEGVTETFDGILDYSVTFTVNADNSVSIAAWDDTKLTVKDGSGYYDAKKATFYVKWNYIRDGVEYQVGGAFVNQKGQLVE